MSLPFTYLDPWFPVEGEAAQSLEQELLRELRNDHVLAGTKFKAIAQRCDCDDALFEVNSEKGSLAVVHLTWSGKQDPHLQFPWTIFYRSMDSFKEENMIPEHKEYVQ